MNTVLTQVGPITALAVALIAALTDAKTGKIPNRLTFPILLVAPIALGLIGGAGQLASSLLGGLLCALIPWLMYQLSHRTAIGGGDVKLYAALGILMGPTLGLEVEFASFVLLGAIAVTRLTFTGRLWRLLVSTGWLLVNPFLPRRLRRTMTPDAFTEMRLGPAIFLGVLLVVVVEHFGVGKWLA